MAVSRPPSARMLPRSHVATPTFFLEVFGSASEAHWPARLGPGGVFFASGVITRRRIAVWLISARWKKGERLTWRAPLQRKWNLQVANTGCGMIRSSPSPMRCDSRPPQWSCLTKRPTTGTYRRKSAASPIHCSKNGTTRQHGPDAERDSLRSPWLRIPFYKRAWFSRDSACYCSGLVKGLPAKSMR